MADSIKLSAAVIFVRELQRSTDFYRDILQLRAEVTSDEATLLTAPNGDHIVLRALPRASKPAGTVGVQFVVWTARDNDDLDRCERELKARDAFVSVGVEQEARVVEGRDPDGVPILIVYPSRPGIGMTSVPTRTYAY
jgi:catechol 2,3-dioxygenase-like lactoylglutathione lyase family enzyme